VPIESSVRERFDGRLRPRRVRYLRIAATAAVVALAAACGPGTSVVLEPSAPLTAAGGGDGGSGSGGQGGNGDESGADADNALTTCLHRFDKVDLDGGPSWDAWRKSGGQRVWVKVAEEVARRFDRGELPLRKGDGDGPRDRGLRHGYIDGMFDSTGARIIIVLDPKRADLESTRRHLQAIADAEQRRKPVHGDPIKVEVFRGCASAARFAAIRREILDDTPGLGVVSLSGPNIRSLVQVGVQAGHPDAVRDLRSRYGQLVEVHSAAVSATQW
jgi:hypothetical protein